MFFNVYGFQYDNERKTQLTKSDENELLDEISKMISLVPHKSELVAIAKRIKLVNGNGRITPKRLEMVNSIIKNVSFSQGTNYDDVLDFVAKSPMVYKETALDIMSDSLFLLGNNEWAKMVCLINLDTESMDFYFPYLHDDLVGEAPLTCALPLEDLRSGKVQNIQKWLENNENYSQLIKIRKLRTMFI